MSGPYTQPLVYFFGQGRADGTAAMKDVTEGGAPRNNCLWLRSSNMGRKVR